jgi:hypothetical protein
MARLPADLLEQRRELAEHTHHFILVPRRWRRFGYRGKLRWRTVPLSASRAPALPDGPGVYALIVASGVASRLAATYLMYVGKSNSLRQRFRNYIRESRSDFARPKLAMLLRLYAGCLHFRFARVSRTGITRAENELIGALLPPANDQLPADIRPARAAFN